MVTPFFSKVKTARITLHSVFLLVILSYQPVFKAMYIKGYHFNWRVDYQPLALMFYAEVITFIYVTAFVAMRKNTSAPRKIVLIITTFLGFIFVRWGLDQYVDKWLFGRANYAEDTTFSYFFHDNLVFSFYAILAGLFLKFMDDWYVNDRIKSALERQNLRLELDFLKSQVNPHFLFNTLNNIQSFIVQDEKMKSIELIGRLSEFMRFSLYECDEEFISLAKEINMLDDYIALERVRCEDRVEILFNRQGNFDNADIPPKLLIPFVENAFKHGADMQLKASWIHINIVKEANLLAMKVSNNFIPRETGKKSGGIGIQNVNKRLQHYFPGKHTLQLLQNGDIFEADLRLELYPSNTDK